MQLLGVRQCHPRAAPARFNRQTPEQALGTSQRFAGKRNCHSVCRPLDVPWPSKSARQGAAERGEITTLLTCSRVRSLAAARPPALLAAPMKGKAPGVFGTKRHKTGHNMLFVTVLVLIVNQSALYFKVCWAWEGIASEANHLTWSCVSGVQPLRKRSPGFPGELITETIKAHDK